MFRILSGCFLNLLVFWMFGRFLEIHFPHRPIGLVLKICSAQNLGEVIGLTANFPMHGFPRKQSNFLDGALCDRVLGSMS